MNKRHNETPLDDEEQELAEMIASGEILISKSATKPVTLRVSEADIIKLKQKANEAGVPYQTLLNSIIHRYVNGGITINNPL